MQRTDFAKRSLQLLWRPQHVPRTRHRPPAVGLAAAALPTSQLAGQFSRCLTSSSNDNHEQRRQKQHKHYQKKKANNRSTNTKKQSSPTIANIQQSQNVMQKLLDRLVQLQYSPSTVEGLAFGKSSIHEEDNDTREEIIDETKQFYKDLCQAVEKGNLSPSRKHGKDLSRLMECVLYTFSCCASLDGPNLSQECQKVLNTLRKDWNLDIQNSHYEYAIVVANHEQNFKLASRLFEEQIDPNAGNTVVPIAVDNPQGLYAIAKLYSADIEDPSELSTAAEHVMDAVQRLVMVSPQDQTTYILAAGNALGYAGRWQDIRQYWKSNALTQQYGTPVVAAVMQACWLCGRSQEAWKVLNESNLLVTRRMSFNAVSTTPGFGGEWQYGGERDLMDPLVRDLAMKVVPDATVLLSRHDGLEDDGGSSDSSPLSDIALDLYHQALEERVTVSREALLGVVRACEQEGRWQDALSIFSLFFDEEKQLIMRNDIDPWIVPGNHLFIEERGYHRQAYSSDNLPQMTKLLASVMRSCNASSNFGISLFCLHEFDMFLSITNGNGQEINHNVSMEEQIDHFLSHLDDAEDLLIASMVALCGLRCYQQAIDLYHADPKNSSSTAASTVKKYAMTNQARFGTLVLGNSWVSAQRHMVQLLQAEKILAQHGLVSVSEDAAKIQHIEHILGRAMNSCTNAHQPQLSLHLLEWTNQNILQNGTIDSPALFSDLVTAETVLARRWAHDATGAVELFDDVVQRHASKLSEWRLTTSAGLTALIASGRGDDAMTIFKSLDDSALCTDAFTAIARCSSKRNKWKEVINFYRFASMKGFSSEELSFMAMKAVISTKTDNRLRILRAITEECASNVGADAQTWMTSRYWQIKRELGFYYARLLMWWNDPNLALVDELNLAIKEFHHELSNDLRPKNDVVRVIVDGPNLLESIGLKDLHGYERVPRTVEQWSSLISELIEATKGSPIQYDPNFVDSIVRGYKSLGCSRECVDYISELMDADGIRVRKSTLLEALEAARVEQAGGLYKDIELMLSKRKSSSD